MSTQTPIRHTGLRHVALNIGDVAAAVAFYTSVFDMRVVWQPDPDNAYLSSGCDNLALHRAAAGTEPGRLDHIGFVVPSPDEVDRAAALLTDRGVPIVKPVRTHRDGSRSVYCEDPDGTLIQILYEPTISRRRLVARD